MTSGEPKLYQVQSSHIKLHVHSIMTFTVTVCSWSERRRTMLATCNVSSRIDATYRDIDKRVLANIFVDDRRRVLACFVAKAGCTTWKYLLIQATGRVASPKVRFVHSRTFMRRLGLRVLSDYEPSAISRRLRTYYKFMVVRHPLVRLLSAYRDKLGGANEYYNRRLGRHIVASYRSAPSRNATSLGDDVTFKEFVSYVLAEQGGKQANDHWLRYWQVCDPCRVKYDAVAKLETMAADAETILPRLSPDKPLRLPTFNKMRAEPVSGATGRHLAAYGNITDEQMGTLLDLYGFDMRLFGYEWRAGQMATCDKHQCC